MGYLIILAGMVILFLVGGLDSVIGFVISFALYGLAFSALRFLVRKVRRNERSASGSANHNLPWYIALGLSFVGALASALGSASPAPVDVTPPAPTAHLVRRESQSFSYLADSSWVLVEQAENGELMQASTDTMYAIHLFPGLACKYETPDGNLECYQRILRSTYEPMSDDAQMVGSDIYELDRGTTYAISYYLPQLAANGQQVTASSLTVYLPLSDRTFVAKCWATGRYGITDAERDRVLRLLGSIRETSDQ